MSIKSIQSEVLLSRYTQKQVAALTPSSVDILSLVLNGSSHHQICHYRSCCQIMATMPVLCGLFPGSLPFKYQFSPTLLNSPNLTRSSAFKMVWKHPRHGANKGRLRRVILHKPSRVKPLYLFCNALAPLLLQIWGE